MARSKAITTIEDKAQVNTQALAAAGDAAAQVGANALAIIEQYGLKTADTNLIWDQVRVYMDSSVEMMMEVGKRLVYLKAVVPHGEYAQRCEALGISARTALNIRKATMKFFGASEKMKSLGRAKLFELMVLDDEELEELDNGQFALELDEIDKMSALELRRAVRAAKMDALAKEKLLADKNTVIDKLQLKLEKHKQFKPKEGAIAQTEEEAAQLAELRDASLAAEAVLTRLGVVVRDIMAGGEASEPLMAACSEAVNYQAVRMNQIILDAGVPVDFAEMVMPGWMQAGGMKNA